MRNIIKDKKGNVFSIIFLLLILFIVAIIGLLVMSFSSKVTQSYENTGLFANYTIANNANEKIQETIPYTTDYAVFFLFIGGIVGISISGIKTNFSPTVMFIFFLMTILAIFFAAGLVNIYQGFAQTAALSEFGSQLTLTNVVFSRFTPLITLVLCGFVMLLMWGKTGGDIVQ